MSGTSLDGVDAALVRIDGQAGISARLEAFLTVPYRSEQRERIEAALEGGAAELCRLNMELGDWFAEAALQLLAEADVSAAAVAAVGSHGQTVWHEPPSAAAGGATLQLGEAAVIAERLGVPVISDFRARDVAAGGHGAPLVPLVDQLLFSADEHARALQNIGGIANVTFLPPRGVQEPVVAFDTGPGVAVVDAVVQQLTDGRDRFDAEGVLAARGAVDRELLAELLDDPFFAGAPPRSTGREKFGRDYARAMLRRGRELGLADTDIVATATALTAHSIADAYRRFLSSRPPAECIVSGGGVRNPTLLEMLAHELAPLPVRDLSTLGWDPDAREAVAFAVLAYLFQQRETGNLPSVTGARGPRVLGKLTPP